MEKTYYVATLFFGCIITLAILCFAIVCFYLHYLWIGIFFLLIFAAAISMNVVFARKWFHKSKNG
ncbi:hypothetical protein AN964_13890 [Heyndrickxia shackletonii]|uniref:Uncharacterized protein n=1 Tax=Heyndrickxia shackletonii TaxID=157838 RepID=A0A0Q3TLD9_9BACI|nr:hypothetical protein AN964_13890 [Heyndrickxia shackletonii]